MSFRIVPVILSGGSGTRLWPLSRSQRPKQFINLVGETSLFQKTLERLGQIPEVSDPVVVCNDVHRFMVAEQMQDIGAHHETIILEPVVRNTAPAIAVAAAHLASTEAPDQTLILALPADHLIYDTEAFVNALNVAQKAAGAGRLVTFGIRPDCSATEYGYIQGVGSYSGTDALPVEHFVEKPDRSTAKMYLSAGDYFWNSGMFLFTPEACLIELERFSPALRFHAADALEHAVEDLDFIRLDRDRYTRCENISIDYAVMEHSNQVSMVPMDAGWSDIGSWNSLWNAGDKDEAGNVTQGDVCIENVNNSYIHSENKLVTALGVDSLIIVETHDCLLIMPREHDQNIGRFVTRLKEAGRSEVELHRKSFRHWGNFDCLDNGHRFQVKRITVKPGKSTSTQKHFYRAEHWIVVSGTAEVSCGDKTFMLVENESTYIPLGEIHRLGNPGKEPLEIIEVQSGCYLGEDDIQRFDDESNRSLAYRIDTDEPR